MWRPVSALNAWLSYNPSLPGRVRESLACLSLVLFGSYSRSSFAVLLDRLNFGMDRQTGTKLIDGPEADSRGTVKNKFDQCFLDAGHDISRKVKLPVSKLPMVDGETPATVASSAWEIPRFFL
jgi:hypothetical protein